MKLASYSPLAKLLIFIGLIFLFLGIFSIVFPLLYSYIFKGDATNLQNPEFIMKDWSFLCNMQLWTSICVFLAPSLLVAHWYSNGESGRYLFSNALPSLKQCLITVILLLAIMPFIGLIGEWNNRIDFPESLSGIETWMRQQEDTAQNVVNRILDVESTADWLFVFLILAISAGITEEFLFRGVMQRLLLEKFKRVHLSIWITAFIFSTIHLQFFGFFPRILLGAFCGYLLAWTGNIWIPVLAHTLNNAAYVATEYAIKQGWTTAEAVEMDFSGESFAIAIAGLAVFVLLARRFKNKQAIQYKQNILSSSVKSIFEINPEEINRTFSDEK